MTDALDALEIRVAELPQARQTEVFGQTLREATGQLENIAAEVSSLQECAHSIHLLEQFWGSDEKPEVLEALRRLEDLGRQIESAQDRDQLALVPNLVREAKPRIALIIRDGARVWNRRLDHDLGSLASLGSLLVQFPDTRVLGQRMASVAATISALKNAFPPAEAAIGKHQRVLQDAEEARKDLAVIGAGESVQTFLAALADRKATLSMLDADVLSWIRDRHAESRFGISLNQ